MQEGHDGAALRSCQAVPVGMTPALRRETFRRSVCDAHLNGDSYAELGTCILHHCIDCGVFWLWWYRSKRHRHRKDPLFRLLGLGGCIAGGRTAARQSLIQAGQETRATWARASARAVRLLPFGPLAGVYVACRTRVGRLARRRARHAATTRTARSAANTPAKMRGSRWSALTRHKKWIVPSPATT